MHTPDELAYLINACRWSVVFASRAPRPLFASPGFHFQLTPAGMPIGFGDAFLSRYEVAKHPPERLLQRLAERSSAPQNGVALCYALDDAGDIHAETEQLPAMLLVYLHLPATATYCRRLLHIDRDARRAVVLPNQVLPFDFRFMPALSASVVHDVDAVASELRVH